MRCGAGGASRAKHSERLGLPRQHPPAELSSSVVAPVDGAGGPAPRRRRHAPEAQAWDGARYRSNVVVVARPTRGSIPARDARRPVHDETTRQASAPE